MTTDEAILSAIKQVGGNATSTDIRKAAEPILGVFISTRDVYLACDRLAMAGTVVEGRVSYLDFQRAVWSAKP